MQRSSNKQRQAVKLERARPHIQQAQSRGDEAKQIGPKYPFTEVSDSGCCFQAGRLQQFVPAWKDITSDPEVLAWVEHCHIEFIDTYNEPPILCGGKFNDK